MSAISAEQVTVRGAPPGLEAVVVCAIWREIAVGSAAAAADIPANVYASLNVITCGDVKLGDATGESLPPIFVTGPFTAPLKTSASSPLKSLCIVLQPWLLRSHFQQEPHDLTNAILAGDRIPSLSDPAITESLHAAVADPERLTAALKALRLAQTAEGEEAASMAALLSESQSVTETAAQLAISVRQLERRFVRLLGLTPREWLRVKRFEGSLIRLAVEDESLAEVAAAAGYTDQSHMTRDFRRAAGVTPQQTKGGIAKETPGYWAFSPAKAIKP